MVVEHCSLPPVFAYILVPNLINFQSQMGQIVFIKYINEQLKYWACELAGGVAAFN